MKNSSKHSRPIRFGLFAARLCAALAMVLALLPTAYPVQAANLPALYYPATPNLPIPDSFGLCGTAGQTVTSTIPVNVPAGFTLNDLNVGLNITHTWQTDLTVKLTNPGGLTVTLINTRCPNSTRTQNIVTVLDDESTGGSVQNAYPPTGPSYTPYQALSAFDG